MHKSDLIPCDPIFKCPVDFMKVCSKWNVISHRNILRLQFRCPQCQLKIWCIASAIKQLIDRNGSETELKYAIGTCTHSSHSQSLTQLSRTHDTWMLKWNSGHIPECSNSQQWQMDIRMAISVSHWSWTNPRGVWKNEFLASTWWPLKTAAHFWKSLDRLVLKATQDYYSGPP